MSDPSSVLFVSRYYWPELIGSAPLSVSCARERGLLGSVPSSRRSRAATVLATARKSGLVDCAWSICSPSTRVPNAGDGFLVVPAALRPGPALRLSGAQQRMHRNRRRREKAILYARIDSCDRRAPPPVIGRGRKIVSPVESWHSGRRAEPDSL
jgi:hypothetical protein